ncbi:hypothetical protein [Cognatilysobacter lacus]|uniref:Lipoprotein n=1 Tax=Cognatilysobacter lacus TaxID=1643323 RepID=A0A5D8ZA91_9GAMM|nr:hypothetical protein [Lysobacter lacus]TZF91042.1 hypothetical protein FW784_02895 [Lysobacter lacus]
MARFRIAGVVATTLLLAGCAGMHDRSTYVAPVKVSHATVEQDTAYIARVEEQARIRGIGVTWINPPTRHKAVAPR